MKQIITFCCLVILTLAACEKNNDKNISLNGVWIESSYSNDTLVFSNQTHSGLFVLNRGLEVRNGYLLPKDFAGVYDYKISGDSISLQYSLLNCICRKNYYFNFDEINSKIEIGNFYEDSIRSKRRLIFTLQTKS